MIRSQRRGADLLVVTIDRPAKRNALTASLIGALTHELRHADTDDSIRGVVLTGAGPSFCAGVDLHEFATGSPDSARILIGALAELCATVRRLSIPVACAIHGYCLGGALEVAACCDFRVSTPDARLGMPEVFIGIPSVIDAVMLGHLVGVGRARELLLTGEPISGELAHDWGLVNRLAPRQDVVQVATDLLGLVTRHLPAAIAAQKRLHQDWLDLAYGEAIERSADALVDAFRSGTPQRIATDRLRRP